MTEQRDKRALINAILDNEEEQSLEEEEIIHLLLESKLSRNTSKTAPDQLTFGERMSDRIASFAGSWPFIIVFIICLISWIALNLLMAAKAFDPYPFILLNLMLSCVAALQAPVIMMSQNRQEMKDRLRSYNDYKTNLKSEIILEDLHNKIDLLIENQEHIMKRLESVENRGRD